MQETIIQYFKNKGRCIKMLQSQNMSEPSWLIRLTWLVRSHCKKDQINSNRDHLLKRTTFNRIEFVFASLVAVHIWFIRTRIDFESI